MNVLGISALYHDSAASLVINGEIVAAAQEERFTRVKHDFSMPVNAIEYCLKEGKIISSDIDIVVFYDNPFLTLDRYMKNILAAGEDSREVIERSFDSMFGSKIWIHKVVDAILGENKKRKFYVCEHHISHAASAFYPSLLHLMGLGNGQQQQLVLGRARILI